MKFIIYMAMSLDGYIADKNGSVEFLDKYQTIDNEQSIYKKFIKTIDCIVMGSKTYEQVLTFGPWPYKDKDCYVLSRNNYQDNNLKGVFSVKNSLVKTLKEKTIKKYGLWAGQAFAKVF